eukprot:938448_1
MATSFKRIDDALAQHYANYGRNDYLDENGIGKFMRFVTTHAFDEDELGDEIDSDECLFVEMDPTFPLQSLAGDQITEQLRNEEIVKILKHCYEHGVPPPSMNPMDRVATMASVTSPERSNMDKEPIQRIDDALAQYYEDCGRNDYFDDASGMGKYRQFVMKYGLHNTYVDCELGDDIHGPRDCIFVTYIDEVDPLFPLPIFTNESRDSDIFQILKHCYKYGVAPSSNWQHIANALRHELYDKVADTLMAIANQNGKRFQNVNKLLEAIKNERHIHQKELNYIRKLMVRQFYYNTCGRGPPKPNRKQMMMDMDDDIDRNSEGLSFNLLIDIYNVHKCFLFGNYHFQHYDVEQFADDIEKSKHLNPQTKKCIKNSGFEDHITTIDLYPSYIIDDDMYETCKYLFCVSRIVHKKRETKHPFSLRLCIIPKRVVCIYDHDVVIPFAINDIASYLESKRMKAIKIHIRHSEDMMLITALLEDVLSNVLCIVDRRHDDGDVFYIIHTSSDTSYTLDELNQNYIIGWEFNVLCAVQCHLRYKEGRTRFYPEHLTTIMPRFFTRNTQLNYAQNIDKLYEDWYKHGFAVDLNDATFDKYYKIITKFDHISVNYNRDVIEEKRDQNRLDIDKISKRTSKCTLYNTLEIKQCTFIDYIIYCLNLFKEMKADAIAFDEFDLSRLRECYTHIICVHSFCLDAGRRQEIKTYVANVVGACTRGEECLCIKQHSMRRGEINEEKEEIEWDKEDILNDILMSCLNSLHCYLLHDDQYLYRIRREDGHGMDSDVRFTSLMHSDPLSFHDRDEMDEFITFILHESNTLEWVSHFVEWLNAQHYDWDAVVRDLGCNTTQNVLIPNQSNIYSFLKQQKQQNLFAILNEKYVEISTIGALNFGVSVLLWFGYGFKSEYESLSDEAYRNAFSKMTKQMLQKYHEECNILCQSAETPYRYTLDELLSLKMYTDESKLTALFRKAFWTDSTDETRREFYHWAIAIHKACLYHSRPLPRYHSSNKSPKTIYHGINKVFANKNRAPKYYGPVSTTVTDSVAHSFSGDGGLLWHIITNYYNPFVRVIGIDLCVISRFKNEDEVLLNDQYIHITKTRHFAADDMEIKADHLLYKLKVYGEEIIDCNLFWKQIGFEVDNQDTDVISHIAKHSLLLRQSEYKNKLVLERLVEELELSNHAQIKTEYLLNILRTQASRIESKERFWKRIGFTMNDDPHSISFIKNHPLFAVKTAYKNKSVIHRLIEELEMYHFADEYWKHSTHFTDHLYVSPDGTAVAFKDVIVDDSGISLFTFTTNKDSNEDEYCFDDADSFYLPIIADTVNGTINIYAKPKIGSFPWIHIKAIKCDEWITQYSLKRDEPLHIMGTMTINPLDEEYCEKGKIQIICNTDIVIDKAAQISADACGMNKEMSSFYHKYNAQTSDNQICLKYGTFADASSEQKMDCESVDNARGGGIIELISQSNIVNNGTLRSNASDPYYLGGTICIKTSKCFVNNGNISAQPHGQIIIKCASFVNNGTIAPEPMVIRTSVEDDMDMDCTFGVVCPSFIRTFPILDKIKLNVHQHHGHYGEYKPENLLDGSNDTYYCSARGKTSGDWITFRMHELAYIRKIRIVNGDRAWGIRQIALFVGYAEQVNPQWIQLCKPITNIKMCEANVKRFQEFDIKDSLSDYFMMKNKFNLLSMKILKNHGWHDFNMFYQFEVFGVEYK